MTSAQSLLVYTGTMLSGLLKPHAASVSGSALKDYLLESALRLCLYRVVHLVHDV